jgi:hypothetical protein
MGTAETGNATEAAVLNAFVERGFDVLLPFGGGHAFDLVVHVDGRFLRVQCKTARQRGGCLAFNSRTTDHGRGRLPYDGLADLFGVFAASTSGVYLVPVRAASTYISHLRTEAPLNGQRRGVRFAADYDIDRWSAAALVEVVLAGRSEPAGDATPLALVSGAPGG